LGLLERNGSTARSGQLAEVRVISPRYAAYALGLLCLTNAFNIGDRLLLGIIQEPIKYEFALSDFQLGLLGGPAFAVLYSLMSIPIARVADRSNRITVVSLALALWSSLTGACGLASSYAQLLVARLGISVGEAGAVAPSLSYISEIFSPRRRATAMAVFAIGGPGGALLATIFGGRIAEHYGWRASFLCFGAVGVTLALLVRLTLREVRQVSAQRDTVAFSDAIRWLVSRKSYIHVCVAGIYASFCASFIMQYMTSFLMRVHELSLANASLVVGLAGGIFGMIGAFFGGFLADTVAKKAPSRRTLVVAVAFVIGGSSYAAAFWAPLAMAIPLLFLGSLCTNSYPGVSFAVASSVAPTAIRATSLAIFTIMGNLFGYAVGPPLLGILSDFLAQWKIDALGVEGLRCMAEPALAFCVESRGFGLRVALSVAGILLFGGSVHYWLASHTLERDMVDG